MADAREKFRAKVAKLKQAVANALLYGAMEYANGNGRARPIVDAHFTAGNAERYAWPPLSEAYFLAKQRGIVKHAGGAYYLSPKDRARADAIAKAEKAGNAALGGHNATGGRKGFLAGKLGLRTGSKIDPAVPFRSKASKEGEAAGLAGGEGTGANLPMLVLTSDLRTAMNSRGHRVELLQNGAVARITFRNLPEYAKFLHEGTPTMPARSPVIPNLDDRAQVVAAMQRYLDRALGKVKPAQGGAAAAPTRAA